MTTTTTGVSLATSLLFHIGEKDSRTQKEDVGAKAREQLLLRARPLRATRWRERERASSRDRWRKMAGRASVQIGR